MRVTTIFILSLLALLFPGLILTRSAIAADKSKTLTEQLQESGIFAPSGPSENSRRELFSEPFTPSASPDPNSRRELFSEPFYAGEKQVIQKKEKALSQGSEGVEVAAVQQRLQAHGFDPGSIDSVFGSRTAIAVRAFQQLKGLKADGAVNEATWNALAEKPMRSVQNYTPSKNTTKNVLAKGATGSKVKTLQARLENQGYNPGPVDGIFGARTMAAVQDFQQVKGLVADGTVDETTWATLSKN